MRKSDHRLKLNNAGAALVTVIVVIAFVSVMATVLMYSAGINFYMKTTDMKIKNNFYETETAMEQIRSTLVDIAGDAYEKTYKDAMIYYGYNANDLTGNSSFKYNFVQNFNNIWTSKITGTTKQAYLRSVIDSAYSPYLTCDTTALELHEAEGFVLLKGVKILYVKDGYESVIETDFIIKAPEVNIDLVASANSWDPADTDHDKAKSRKELDLLTCVNYYNWVKK